MEPKSFWMWIAQHLDEIRLHATNPDSDVMAAMVVKLHQYDPSLGVEISVSDAHELEVVITAFGERGCFSSVKELVGACPHMPGVRPVAFRRPAEMDFNLNIGSHVFSPSGVWFEPMIGRDDPKSVGLMIFFPAADEIPREQRLQLAQVMLQTILGEYEFALRVDHLEVADSAGVELHQYIPLSDVAAYLSWFEKQNPRTQQ